VRDLRKLAFIPILLVVSFYLALDIPKDFGKVSEYSYRVIAIRNRIVNIDYPVFEGEFAKVNGYIKDTVEKMWNSWKGLLLDNYRAEPRMSYSYNLTFRIYMMDEKVLSLVLEDHAFTGGAHGLSTRKGINYDVSNERILKLEDIFVKGSGWKDFLNKKIKEYFKYNQYTLKEFEGVKGDEEFYMTRCGIVIFFQLYEYTAFAGGFPEIFINYDELKDFLKDEYKLLRE
jgi:hypothetical protein